MLIPGPCITKRLLRHPLRTPALDSPLHFGGLVVNIRGDVIVQQLILAMQRVADVPVAGSDTARNVGLGTTCTAVQDTVCKIGTLPFTKDWDDSP